MEPDYGGAMFVFIAGMFLLFLGGARPRYLIPALLAGIAWLAGIVALSPNRLARLTAFLDVEGNKTGFAYQLNESLNAFALGGWTGAGPEAGQVVQIPGAQGDFMLAVVGQRFGLLAAFAVVALFWVILVCGLGKREAMRFIANMYFHQGFRPVRVSGSGFRKTMINAVQQSANVIMPQDCADQEEPDYASAWQWYLKAAELGDIDSMSDAGVMAFNGIGCEKDVALAQKLLGEAARQGNPFAQKTYHDFIGEITLDFKTDAQYQALLADFERAAD